MIDLVHHIHPEAVPKLFRTIFECLPEAGTLIVKDVDTHPAPKRWFTWVLDRLMDPRTPVHCWSAQEMAESLERTGFRVRRHAMVDLLPYPHMLYICEKRKTARA